MTLHNFPQSLIVIAISMLISSCGDSTAEMAEKPNVKGERIFSLNDFLAAQDSGVSGTTFTDPDDDKYNPYRSKAIEIPAAAKVHICVTLDDTSPDESYPGLRFGTKTDGNLATLIMAQVEQVGRKITHNDRYSSTHTYENRTGCLTFTEVDTPIQGIITLYPSISVGFPFFNKAATGEVNLVSLDVSVE